MNSTHRLFNGESQKQTVYALLQEQITVHHLLSKTYLFSVDGMDPKDLMISMCLTLIKWCGPKYKFKGKVLPQELVWVFVMLIINYIFLVDLDPMLIVSMISLCMIQTLVDGLSAITFQIPNVYQKLEQVTLKPW